MLEEEPKKVGFRLSNKRLRDTVERQIFATKYVENIPSTIFASGEFKPQNNILGSLKQKDPSMMTGGSVDFNTNIRTDVLAKSPLSDKRFIQPVPENERAGPKWHSSSTPDYTGPAGQASSAKK